MEGRGIEFGGEALDRPTPVQSRRSVPRRSLRDIYWSLLPSGVGRSFVAAGARLGAYQGSGSSG